MGVRTHASGAGPSLVDHSDEGAHRHSAGGAGGLAGCLCKEHHLPCGSGSSPAEKIRCPSCRALSGNKTRSAGASLVSKEK